MLIKTHLNSIWVYRSPKKGPISGARQPVVVKTRRCKAPPHPLGHFTRRMGVDVSQNTKGQKQSKPVRVLYMELGQSRYLLYIDILGFADMVREQPERIPHLYEVIDSLNAHKHPDFKTIVFSDTILVYNAYAPVSMDDHEFAVMYSIEFAHDLLDRTIGKDIFFRGILSFGHFDDYDLKNIRCFYGTELIRSYIREKKIKVTGLFIDIACQKYNRIFPVTEYQPGLSHVFFYRELGTVEALLKEKANIAEFLSLEEESQWGIAKITRLLEDHFRLKSNHPDEPVKTKHENSWAIYAKQYPRFTKKLVESDFSLEKVIPNFNWSKAIARVNEW